MEKLRQFLKDANITYRDVFLMLAIGLTLMAITDIVLRHSHQ